MDIKTFNPANFLSQDIAAYYIRFHMSEGTFSEHEIFLHVAMIEYITSVIPTPVFSYTEYVRECANKGLAPASPHNF